MGVEAIISSVVSLATGVMGLMAANKQGDVGDKNVRNIELETAEESRRLGRTQRANLAKGEALTGATGLQRSGSMKNFLRSVDEEQGKQLAWLKTSGASKADIANEEAEAAAAGTRARALGDILGAAKGFF